MAKLFFLLEDYNKFYTKETLSAITKNSAIGYQNLIENLISKKYYQSDSMASAFNKLGHETCLVVPEANPLQLIWAKENNKFLYTKWFLERPLRSFKSRFLKQYRNSYNSIQFEILLAQVKDYKPDIIYVYSNIILTEKQVLILKENCQKIVLQWACPLFDEKFNFPYHSFDYIITAAVQIKEYFESKKYKVIFSQQAFDDSILEHMSKNEPKNDAVFIGNFTLAHIYRFEVIEYLLENKVNVVIHGSGKDVVSNKSIVYQKMQTPLFGIDMYNEYCKHIIGLHIHITGFENENINWDKYAGAKRLFEITGAGTLLITSHQDNVKDLFELGKEVITFKSQEELLEKIKYFVEHPEEASEIAKRGQQRTLRDHSFLARAKELHTILFN